MSYTLGIVGATGLVGRALIAQLQTKFLESTCYFFASDRSLGQNIVFRDADHKVLPINDECLDRCDILLAVTDGSISQSLIEKRWYDHVAIIDNASTFRLHPDVPLLIPEINPDVYHGQTVIANPNCTTIQLLLLLSPLLKHISIGECIVSSYQSVSGTGLAAMDELTQGMRALVDDQQPQSLLYPRQIAGNVIPQCDAFNGDWTLEELKIMNESAKILKESVTIHPTCVRVPVYQGHHLAVTVKFNKDIDRATLESIIHHQSRLTLCDRDSYPSSVAVVGSDNVFVSRMRHAPKDLSTWSFWLSADNIRVGAATNAMNILHMIRDRCIK